MPEISIITPCYNAEKFIRRCARSILSQTFSDFEWIVVDDGSTDHSCDIFTAVSHEDKRVAVYSKANGGVSSARNKGLRHASGKWVIFLDIDDTLPPLALQHLWEMSHNSDSVEFVMGGYNIITKSGKEQNDIPERITVLSATDLCMQLFRPSDYAYHGYICSKLYLRKIIEINSIQFDESIKYNEDRLFTFSYLMAVKKGIYTTRPVYNYYQQESSAMATIKGPNYWKFETDLDAFLKMCRIARSSAYVQLQDAVMRGTYASYKWNRRLNKEYGGDNPECNRRLRLKLLSEVSRRRVISYRLTDTVNSLKSRIYTILHGKNN